MNIEEIDKTVYIHFNQKMLIDSEHLTMKSINYSSEEVPSFQFQWIDSQNAKIVFSRLFENEESILLEFLIKREVLGGIKKEERIVIDYGVQ